MIVELPKQHVFGQELYPTIIEKSSILYQKLVQKHVFYNANKRTAYHAFLMFLRANGHVAKIPTDEAIDFTVRIATNDLTTEEIAEWIVKYIEKH